jgi:hypothetical protein
LKNFLTNQEISDQIYWDYRWGRDFREERIQDWNRFYQLYKNYVSKSDYPFMSNLSIPTATTLIEVQTAAILSMIFEAGKFFTVEGKTEYGQIGARAVDQLMDYHMRQSFNIYEDMELFIRQFLMFGTSVYKVMWQYREGVREVEVPVYEGGELMKTETVEIPVIEENKPCGYTVDLYSFGMDPAAGRPDDIRFAWEEMYYDMASLHQMASNDIIDKKALKNITPSSPWVSRGLGERQDEIGFNDHQYPVDPARGKVRVIDYYGYMTKNWDARPGSKKKVQTRLLHVIAALDGGGGEGKPLVLRAEPMPYQHNRIPYVVARENPCVGEMYGTGDIETTESLLLEERDMRNIQLDNLMRTINKMFKVKSGSLEDESELFWRPGGIVHLEDMDDVAVLDAGILDPSFFGAQEGIRADIEHATGVNDFVIGQFRSATGFNDTASGISIIQEAALRRITKKGNTIQRSIKEIGEMTFGLVSQYMPYDQVVKVVDRKSAMGYRFVNVSAEALQNMYDFTVVNAPSLGSKSIQLRQMTELMQLAIQLRNVDQNFAPDFSLFFRRILELGEVPNPEEIFGHQNLNQNLPLLPEAQGTTEGPMALIPPEDENTLMMEGHMVHPKINEDHAYHRVVHQDFYNRMTDPNVKALIAEHDAAHAQLQQMTATMQAQQMALQQNENAVAGKLEQVAGMMGGTNAGGPAASTERGVKNLGNLLSGSV